MEYDRSAADTFCTDRAAFTPALLLLLWVRPLLLDVDNSELLLLLLMEVLQASFFFVSLSCGGGESLLWPKTEPGTGEKGKYTGTVKSCNFVILL
jgi:hypothetical protein